MAAGTLGWVGIRVAFVWFLLHIAIRNNLTTKHRACGGGSGEGEIEEVIKTFHATVRKYFRGPLKPPFNEQARKAAGFGPRWYEPLAVKEDNPKWKIFRHSSLPYWQELALIFGGTYAAGEHVVGNAQDINLSDEDDNREPSDDPVGSAREGFIPFPEPDEFRTEANLSDNQPQVRKHKLDRTPNDKRRRGSTSSDVSMACKAIQEIMKSRVSQTSDISSTTHQDVNNEDRFSVSVVVELLDAMPDLPSELYHKAVDKAIKSKGWREAFVNAIPGRRRERVEILM